MSDMSCIRVKVNTRKKGPVGLCPWFNKNMNCLNSNFAFHAALILLFSDLPPIPVDEVLRNILWRFQGVVT